MEQLTEIIHLCNIDLTPITLCGNYIDEQDDGIYYTFDKNEFLNSGCKCKVCYNKLTEQTKK